jgi:hypothetical protein
MTLHTDTPEKFERAIEIALTGIEIGANAPERKLILNRIS